MARTRPPASPQVQAALDAMPRTRFLPAGQRASAHVDRPLSIGFGQTNSQPSTVRYMLELLEVEPAQRVLDVGSGSGWTAALLGVLVGSNGQVVGVELEPELARWGAGNVDAQQMPWVRVHQADPDRLGWPEESPYDRILVSAGARSLPEPLVEQLKPDGVMVIPVAGRMLRVRRVGPTGDVEIERLTACAFVPLRWSRH